MKIMKLFFMSLFLAAVFVACKKDNDNTPPPFAMEGLWEGKIGTGSVTPSGQYALKVKAGGVVERINSNGSVTASGSWQLNGNNFSATYNYSSGTIVNVTGNVDKGKNKMTATWKNNGNEEGSLYVDKQ